MRNASNFDPGFERFCVEAFECQWSDSGPCAAVIAVLSWTTNREEVYLRVFYLLKQRYYERLSFML